MFRATASTTRPIKLSVADFYRINFLNGGFLNIHLLWQMRQNIDILFHIKNIVFLAYTEQSYFSPDSRIIIFLGIGLVKGIQTKLCRQRHSNLGRRDCRVMKPDHITHIKSSRNVHQHRTHVRLVLFFLQKGRIYLWRIAFQNIQSAK